MRTRHARGADDGRTARFGAGLVLDDELKVSYAAALFHFARIGGVTDAEERTIEDVARALDIDAGSLRLARQAGLDAARLRALLERIDGALLVRDALRVAHSDGIVGEDERRIIARLAEATGLSARRLALVHEWVERERALQADWLGILDAPDRPRRD